MVCLPLAKQIPYPLWYEPIPLWVSASRLLTGIGLCDTRGRVLSLYVARSRWGIAHLFMLGFPLFFSHAMHETIWVSIDSTCSLIMQVSYHLVARA